MTQTSLSINELDKLDKRVRANLINSLSGFKPANLIGTVSNSGVTNLSIISSLFHLGADPALMGFIIRPDVSPRHTLTNLRENSFMTINHVHQAIIEKAHQTSARFPQEVSEFKACQLQEEYLESFKAPYVQESHIKIGLEMLSERLLAENNTHLIIAKIKHIYFPEDIWDGNGPLDIEKVNSISVSGLDTYHSTTKEMRLSYAKIDKKVDRL